ncbi:hypothetical protein VNO80_26757 [Phaseolus coccineus]|uniref:Uncharacterized protein n=1 Tax=Phaseolus coccineus TaxID=3886 RepID=A0AAN9LKF0_PHACN
MMSSKNMEKTIKETKELITTPTSTALSQARTMVMDWATVAKKNLTLDQQTCLVMSMLAGQCNPYNFDLILFGYTLKSEQNVNDMKNVANAIQEMINGSLAVKERSVSCPASADTLRTHKAHAVIDHEVDPVDYQPEGVGKKKQPAPAR